MRQPLSFSSYPIAFSQNAETRRSGNAERPTCICPLVPSNSGTSTSTTPVHPLLAGWQLVVTDFRIIFERDPAARNWLEVLCCYPGFHALVLHRLAHWLHTHRVAFFPRLISHLGRFLTGIEIHPGAQIGKGVVIDHGMGVVIGETAIVGDYCLIYQGVTLGGTGKETGKRHPTLGQHVVVGAGAKVLGNIYIGDRARIGAGSIVLRPVPANCTAVGVPGRNICRKSRKDCPLDHDQMPDAEADVIRSLLDRIEQLEQQLKILTTTNASTPVSQFIDY